MRTGRAPQRRLDPQVRGMTGSLALVSSSDNEHGNQVDVGPADDLAIPTSL